MTSTCFGHLHQVGTSSLLIYMMHGQTYIKNVLFCVLNCFSFPLSYILFFLGLSVVLASWQHFPFLQKVVLFVSWGVLVLYEYSRLPDPQIRADLNKRTINRILPPVIPTHLPHDIQHALHKPTLHTIHNTHIGRSHSMKIDNSSIERVEGFKYLGTTLTNKNSIQEEIKSRLKVRECLLLFSAESFVFQFAIQKVKDQDI